MPPATAVCNWSARAPVRAERVERTEAPPEFPSRSCGRKGMGGVAGRVCVAAFGRRGSEVAGLAGISKVFGD